MGNEGGIVGKIKNFMQEKPILTLLILLGFLGGFVFLNVEVLHFTSSPNFCALCHNKDNPGPLGEVSTWKKTVHAQKGIECLDCHGKPGFFNYMRAKLKGLSDLYNFALKGQKHMVEVLEKSYQDPAHATKAGFMESCLFCHTDYYNLKFRKERLIKLAGLKFRTLDEVSNPRYRLSHNLIDLMTEPVRKNPEVDPKHASHIKGGVHCLFCHRQVAHSGEPIPKVKVYGEDSVCVKCHLENKDWIEMKEIVLAKAGNPARFSHNFHLQMFDCQTCHPSLFKMKAGTTPITFASHHKDEYCFTCHGDNKSASFNCETCHK